MSVHRDTDRTLAAWLDLMPTELPDRVAFAIADAVATTPQLSPRTPRAAWRLSINRTSLAFGAAVVVVVAIVASGLGSRFIGVGASAPPTLRPTPVVTAAPPILSEVPEALHGRWLGGPNGVVDERPDLSLAVDHESVKLVGFRNQVTAASAAFVGLDRLQVAPLEGLPVGLCTSGLLGEYTVRLSPEGKILTLGALRDDCPESSTSLTGTWWRAACRSLSQDCLGPLEPGTYASLYLRPILPSEGGWWSDGKFGELEYTVPSGWANYGEDNFSLGLGLADDYASAPEVANLPVRPGARLVVYAQVGAVLDGCVPMSAPPASDAEGFVAWLRDVPNLVTTGSEPITVDGFAGLSVDLTVDAGQAPPLCHEERKVEFMEVGGNPATIRPGERRRLVVLGLDARNLAVISIEVDEASRFEAFVTEAMPIIESMTFR